MLTVYNHIASLQFTLPRFEIHRISIYATHGCSYLAFSHQWSICYWQFGI